MCVCGCVCGVHAVFECVCGVCAHRVCVCGVCGGVHAMCVCRVCVCVCVCVWCARRVCVCGVCVCRVHAVCVVGRLVQLKMKPKMIHMHADDCGAYIHRCTYNIE